MNTRTSFESGGYPMADWAALAAPFLEAQGNQWAAWIRFQEMLATYYKDLWEQWAVRFAGGAPLDS